MMKHHRCRYSRDDVYMPGNIAQPAGNRHAYRHCVAGIAPPAPDPSRRFNAGIERVFSAWTQPDVLARWFGPEGFSVVDCDLELRVGGTYRLTIQQATGSEIKHFGEYLEIEAPEKLVFTWELDNQDCQGSENICVQTLVSLDFKALGKNATELQLTHEQLPNQQAFDGHSFGWTSSLAELDTYLSKR